MKGTGEMIKNVDGIIFDLDGTLWDAVEVIFKSWRDVIISHKFDNFISIEELKGYMGKRIEDIFKKLFPDVDDKHLNIMMEECCVKECEMLKKEGARLYPYIEETLKYLYKKYPLFIVSNCQEGYIETFLEYNRFEKYFKDFECSGKTGLDKSKNIKIIMERNKIKNPVYIGDAKVDEEASKKADIKFIYASYGFGNVDSYDIKINSLKELMNIF